MENMPKNGFLVYQGIEPNPIIRRNSNANQINIHITRTIFLCAV